MLNRIVTIILSLLMICGLAYAANLLSGWNKVVEYPIWAAGLGIIAGNIPYLSRVIRRAANPELFIKFGLVLLGASVSFSVITAVGWRGLIQVLIGMPLVFFFTWYIARLFKIDDKLRALLSTAVSICGVSAAVAAAGSITAKKEQLTYVITLVILFALPLMVLTPYFSELLHLSPAVAGAWMGNNIDTTAAVTGAAQIYGDEALKIASIVKMGQNVFIGVVAFFLALYFALRVEKKQDSKPRVREIWDKFPKFVIGFVIMSILATLGVFSGGDVKIIKKIQTAFFTVAFVCIGLSFNFKEMRTLGGKPLAVFALATVFNSLTALGLAWVLFSGYED